MTELLEKILLFAFIPVMTMFIGGISASYINISPSWRSAILHFAAGVVFSVVAVELLPDIVERHCRFEVIIGFSLGILSMLLIKKLTESNNMLYAIGVDIVIDGVLLGIGFSAGVKEGILLAIALSIELLSLGMAIAVTLKKENLSKILICFLIGTLGLLFLVAAGSGTLLLHNLQDQAMEIVLSFGLAALLFLVTEELLTEAHEEKETVWHTASFFIGFLLFLILGMSI